MGTAGPGAIHLGLYDAKMDHAPVLAITGQVSLGWIGTDYFQEVNVLRVFDDVARYNYQVSDPQQIDVLASMACRTALAEHGVAHLSFPFEVSTMKTTGHVRRFSVVPHAIGSMGFGLPAAMAAKIADPTRQSIAVVGDGAFTMLMGDFVTAVRYRWPITVVLMNNSRLGMIKFEQEIHGMPEFGTGLTNPNLAQYAQASGGQGFRVTHPDQLDDALTQALHAKVATIVDVLTDADEKPLPPRITASQSVGYMQALFKETFP